MYNKEYSPKYKYIYTILGFDAVGKIELSSLIA